MHDPGGKVRIRIEDGMRSAATFSPCGRYRVLLKRMWGEPFGRRVMFVGMNPSTADAFVNDPTVLREIGFAKREGGHSMVKCNVMDYRATDPKDLLTIGCPPRSGQNLWYIRECAIATIGCEGFVIVAWGALPKPLRHYADEALVTLRATGVPIFCLGRTKDGSPRHPLYLPKTAPLEAF